MNLATLGFGLSQPLLHRMDAETAHGLTLAALKALPCPALRPPRHLLRQNLFGLEFPNPLGLAAGFDKNAEVSDTMLGLGFGFVEAGTLTPRPQIGNPKPRLFRLVEDQAVINRMGFNNAGLEAALARLQQRRVRGVLGINLGANKESDDRVADYVTGIAAVAPFASYITINISSPNTPGLRALQSAEALANLLARVNDARTKQKKHPPLLLKIAPDLDDEELAAVAAGCAGAVDGVIICNTTLSRPRLSSVYRGEAGGLSGAPLRALATRQLATFYQLSGGTIPLVGVGGISDAASAVERIEAGASLLQIYSALVFKGPALIKEILDGLEAVVRQRQLSSIADLVGTRAKALSTRAAPANSG